MIPFDPKPIPGAHYPMYSSPQLAAATRAALLGPGAYSLDHLFFN